MSMMRSVVRATAVLSLGLVITVAYLTSRDLAPRREPARPVRSLARSRAPRRPLGAFGPGPPPPPPLGERQLQCPQYAGPMFFPNYPGARNVPRRAVRAAALPTALDDMPKPRTAAAAAQAPLLSLQPFELDAVRLADSSHFGRAQRTNTAFLRLLEPDRLLYFFRQVARLPQPAGAAGKPLVPLGGWESQGSGLRGEFAGHYLHAAASVAVATSDATLASRCDYIVRVLDECQDALGDGYVSAFPRREFEAVESFESRAPWVPYYVMHKLLAGLIAHHELFGAARSLRVAVRLAEHLKRRAGALIARGLPHWHDFINQEVGGMSEALADLARVTGNGTWLQLAGMFERPCFVGPLARGSAAEAVEKVHANTHLPQLLGVMARYEATGDDALRAASLAFWDEVRTKHTYATGSSTAGEVWGVASNLGESVSHQHSHNYWAHDHAETCVAHNSMKVARRLMAWAAPRADARGGPHASSVAHADYYERTLYNAVLGTQRGSTPGARARV